MPDSTPRAPGSQRVRLTRTSRWRPNDHNQPMTHVKQTHPHLYQGSRPKQSGRWCESVLGSGGYRSVLVPYLIRSSAPLRPHLSPAQPSCLFSFSNQTQRGAAEGNPRSPEFLTPLSKYRFSTTTQNGNPFHQWQYLPVWRYPRHQRWPQPASNLRLRTAHTK